MSRALSLGLFTPMLLCARESRFAQMRRQVRQIRKDMRQHAHWCIYVTPITERCACCGRTCEGGKL